MDSFFSWRALKDSSRNAEAQLKIAQAQMFNQLVVQGRELQYKYMELYNSPDKSPEAEKNRDLFLGTMWGYHASCFEVSRVLELPASVKKLFDHEVKAMLSQAEPRKKWEKISEMYSKEFHQYLSSLQGI